MVRELMHFIYTFRHAHRLNGSIMWIKGVLGQEGLGMSLQPSVSKYNATHKELGDTTVIPQAEP